MTQREETATIEYEELNFEGIERRANYRVIAFREDMQCIFERRDSAALVYHIIYRWLEKKRDDILKELEQRKKQNLPPLAPEEVEARMWIYMSYNDFVRESGQSLGYNTVIRTLDYLVKKKVIEQRENHDPRFAEYEYRINKKVVRELLSELPLFPVFIPKGTKKPGTSTQTGTDETDSTQTGTDSTQTGTATTQTGTATTQTGIELYPNGGTSQNYTGFPQDSPQELTEGDGAFSDEKDAPTPELSSEELSEKVDGAIIGVETVQRHITGEHPAVHLTDTESHYHIANGSAIGNEEEDLVLTVPRLLLPSKHTPSEHAPGALTRAQAHLLDPEPAQSSPPTGSTSTTRTAQVTGFVPPERPRGGKSAMLALTFGGADVKRWIEDIRGVKVRMTANHVKACNALAECDGISLEALRLYFEHVEAQKWEVDLLTAAGETGNDKVGFLSFESNWPKLKKKLNGSQPPPQDWVPDDDDNSVKAALWRQRQRERSAK